MSMNVQAPPDWPADTLATGNIIDVAATRHKAVWQGSGEFLLSRPPGEIYRKGPLPIIRDDIAVGERGASS